MAHRKAHGDAASDLEAKVAEAYERCHPNDTFGDLKARARFSREDRGLLSGWLASFANERRWQASSAKTVRRASMEGEGI